MKWRVRSVYISVYVALLIVLAAPPVRASLSRHLPLSTGIAVLAAAGLYGALYALTFVVFRCPHCRARQIRSWWDWAFVSSRCRQCHQSLDGPARPHDVVEEELIAERNPALAAEMRRDRLALESLRRQASTDARAAQRLEMELSTRVERLSEWVAEVRRISPADEARAREDLRRAQDELALCRSLRSHNS
jgi:hypothetical protein